jgi:hypothetical protein
VEERLQPKQSVNFYVYRGLRPRPEVSIDSAPPVIRVVDEYGLVCRVLVLEERANLYVFPSTVEKTHVSQRG